MAKKGRTSRSSSLERLALFKARPINRDAQRVVGCPTSAGKRRTKDARVTGRPEDRRLKPIVKEPKKSPGAIGGPQARPVVTAEKNGREAKARQISAFREKGWRTAPADSSRRKRAGHLACGVGDGNTTLKCSPCPHCGGRKSQYYACFDCGFSLLKAKSPREPNTRPRGDVRATAQHTGRGITVVAPRGQRSKPLPEWEKTRPKDDVFDRGRVVSGGGVGVAKRRKR